MYNRHFGFRELPFNQTPDSEFFFPSEKHKTALDALIYAIKQRKGFVVVTGEIGSGKTTVIRTLLRRLGNEVKSAVITNTFLTPKGIVTLILEDLGVVYQRSTKERLLLQLNDHLLSAARQDQDVVLLIDEAQNLSPQCLEEVRMLSNLETEKDKLLQIVLIGQPELRKKLEMPRLEQLTQRIAIHYHIEPLNAEETKKYVLHRLNYARANGREMDHIFEPSTFRLIYDFSRGLPRLINKLCDHALFIGFVSDHKVVTNLMIQEAIQDLSFREERRHE